MTSTYFLFHTLQWVNDIKYNRLNVSVKRLVPTSLMRNYGESMCMIRSSETYHRFNLCSVKNKLIFQKKSCGIQLSKLTYAYISWDMLLIFLSYNYSRKEIQQGVLSCRIVCQDNLNWRPTLERFRADQWTGSDRWNIAL